MPKVLILIGSDSDSKYAEDCQAILNKLGVASVRHYRDGLGSPLYPALYFGFKFHICLQEV